MNVMTYDVHFFRLSFFYCRLTGDLIIQEKKIIPSKKTKKHKYKN